MTKRITYKVILLIRINTTGNTAKTTISKPIRKTSQEPRGQTNTNKDSKLKIEKKAPGSSSVGKRKVNTKI